MWVAEVFPITRSLNAYKPFTYFSTKKLEAGALVEVFLRRKPARAIVVKAERLELKKTALKRENFSLKKINRLISERFVAPQFLAALFNSSEYFLSPPSFLLNFFLPKAVLKKSDSSGSKENSRKDAFYKIALYQAARPERMKYYRGVMREALGRNQSVLVILPTIGLAEEAFSDLRAGLEEKVFLFHPDMPSRVLVKNWKEISESIMPVAVIGTAQALTLLRPDTGILVVEEEASENYYQTLRRPFLDLRKFAEFLAQAAGLHLIFGDVMLRLGADESRYLPTSISRVLSPVESKIIDSRADKSLEFKIISEELEKRLKATYAKKDSMVLIGHRRGFTPITLCQDCGHVLGCGNCSSPLVLHKPDARGGQAPRFFCHYCLQKTEAVERCPNCKSWRISAYGVGIEKIGQELKNILPDANLFRFDRDSVRSRKEAERLKYEFLERQGGILVATEFFLNFFQNPLPHVAVVSVDGLFSIPDYRMHERAMIFLTRLRALAQKSFLIQTRLPSNPVFVHASLGNLSGFKSEELAERRKLGYPPAVDLLKLTLEDVNRARLVKKVSELAAKIKQIEAVSAEKFDSLDFPAFIVKIRGRFRWHILLRLARGSWPEKHKELRELLKNLPPSWVIQVDPPSLL